MFCLCIFFSNFLCGVQFARDRVVGTADLPLDKLADLARTRSETYSVRSFDVVVPVTAEGGDANAKVCRCVCVANTVSESMLLGAAYGLIKYEKAVTFFFFQNSRSPQASESKIPHFRKHGIHKYTTKPLN